MSYKILKKVFGISTLLLVVLVASCGKMSGNDDGTGGGGGPDDPKNLDFKKIIKFDTSSRSEDTIKLQSFDLNSKTSGKIPIELDLATVKNYKGDYKVGVTILDKQHVNVKDPSALEYGFNDLKGGQKTIILNNGDDVTKQKAVLYFSTNSLVSASSGLQSYAVFSIIFNVSYKNGSQIAQENSIANIIVSRRYIIIGKSQKDKNDSIDVISRSNMDKDNTLTKIMVNYYSAVPSAILKDGLYESADYEVIFGPFSSKSDADIVNPVNKILHFQKDKTSSNPISIPVEYKPHWDDTYNQAQFLFRDVSNMEYAKDISGAPASYIFFRCDDTNGSLQQFYFLDSLATRTYESTYNVVLSNTEEGRNKEMLHFIICGKGVGSTDVIEKYTYNVTDSSQQRDYLRFKMIKTEAESTFINRELYNTDNYISNQNNIGVIYLKAGIKPEEYQNLANLTVDVNYKLGADVNVKRTIKVSSRDSVAFVHWGDAQATDVRVPLDPDEKLTALEVKVDNWSKDPLKDNKNIAEVRFTGAKGGGFCFLEKEDGDCDTSNPDLVIKVKKTDQGIGIAKVYIKPIKAINKIPIGIEGLLKDEMDPKTDNFYPSVKSPDETKAVTLTITPANANFYPCMHETNGACIGGSTKSPVPDSNVFKVLKGSNKHFIIEISSVNDNASGTGKCSDNSGSPLGEFHLRPFMYLVPGSDYDHYDKDKDKDNIKPITDPSFKIYKLSTGLDESDSGDDTPDMQIGRKIKDKSVCFEGGNQNNCRTMQAGKGDCRQFFLVEDNRTDGRKCPGAQSGQGCITVVGVSNYDNDDAIMSRYPAKSWRYIEIEKAEEHNPNIKFTGLRGSDNRGWGKCSMRAVSDSGNVFRSDNAIKIFRTGQKINGSLVVANNMTKYGTKKDYCSLGVIPDSSSNLLCNSPMLKYGDKLSVLDNDFTDLKVDFVGFDSEWNSNDKTMVIQNYSGQLGYLNDKYDEKGSPSYVDSFFQNSTFTFSLRLPVGDPNMSQCGMDEYNHNISSCPNYPSELAPYPNWGGASSLYGNLGGNICASYSPDLIVDVKGFNYHTYGATKRCDHSGNCNNVDALVLTNICSVTGDGGTQSKCDFNDRPHPGGDFWDNLLRSNFYPGTCTISGNQFNCNIDGIL